MGGCFEVDEPLEVRSGRVKSRKVGNWILVLAAVGTGRRSESQILMTGETPWSQTFAAPVP